MNDQEKLYKTLGISPQMRSGEKPKTDSELRVEQLEQSLNDPFSSPDESIERSPAAEAPIQDTPPVSPAPPEVSENDTLANLRANIQKYQDKMNAPKKELDWKERLPDILSAAHNIVNYGQGSQQKMLGTDYAKGIETGRDASKKEGLSQIQNLQKMYQDYMTAEGKGKPAGMSPYQKAQLDNAQKDRELKEKLATLKAESAPKVPSFIEKETIKADLKEKSAQQKENRTIRKEAEKSLSDIDKNIANVKKAAELMKKATKNIAFDTGPLDQWAASATDDGQKLRQTFNEISLDKMTKMFAGMSKAIDSDAERKFFEQSQVSMGSYPEVNMNILNKMLTNLESLKAKNKNTMKVINKKGELKEEPSSEINEVKRITKDGRSAVFNADTREFLRYE